MNFSLCADSVYDDSFNVILPDFTLYQHNISEPVEHCLQVIPEAGYATKPPGQGVLDPFQLPPVPVDICGDEGIALNHYV